MTEQQETQERPDDVLDEEPLTVKEGVALVIAQSDRVKAAGWKPFRDMVGSYVGKVADAMKGLADGFEGKSKRGG